MSFQSKGGEKWSDGQADLKIPICWILMSLPLDALGDFFFRTVILLMDQNLAPPRTKDDDYPIIIYHL